jgi:nitrous oxidase accessory protein
MKIIFTIIAFILCSPTFASIIKVGKQEIITSLSKAISNAASGDTILLHKGVYREGNITITKPVVIIGIGDPVLDGEEKYEIMTLTGSGIIIRGITFRNSGNSVMNDHASISIIDAHSIIIENNTILNSYFAIHVANANDCIIRNNRIEAKPKNEQTSGNGIHLWKCSNIVVESNNIKGHRDGIYFEFVSHSVIEDNNSQNNIRYGLHFMFSNNNAYLGNKFTENGAGVAVMYSNHVLMQRNVFEKNWGANAYGLLLKEISDAQIRENFFTGNTVGILMESTNRLEVELNRFIDNGWGMRIQASCNENNIHHNNFIANTFDVATNSVLSLNRFYNNYWDKYEGYDLNRDIVGDIPFHPVSMYSMVIEQNPDAVILLRSFMVSLLDKAEKAIPSLTPENMKDEEPLMKPLQL